MTVFLLYFTAAMLLLVAQLLHRQVDERELERAWQELALHAHAPGRVFDPAMVRDLPPPAQRFFTFTIRPETELACVAEIEMTGEIALGGKASPRYRPMSAKQILAPPYGLVWRFRAGPISGSDGVTPARSWTRIWLLGLFPLARICSDRDHQRSAFGRVIAEAAFWAPASLLPSSHVRWESIDDVSARAVVSYGEFEQAVELTVDADGRPTRVMIPRWSNVNRDRVYREQPFGGYLDDFSDVAGYRLPMRVDGGNQLGTNEYFPFYRATVKTIRLRKGEQAGGAMAPASPEHSS